MHRYSVIYEKRYRYIYASLYRILTCVLLIGQIKDGCDIL